MWLLFSSSRPPLLFFPDLALPCMLICKHFLEHRGAFSVSLIFLQIWNFSVWPKASRWSASAGQNFSSLKAATFSTLSVGPFKSPILSWYSRSGVWANELNSPYLCVRNACSPSRVFVSAWADSGKQLSKALDLYKVHGAHWAVLTEFLSF